MASRSAVIEGEMIQIPPNWGSSLEFDFAHLRIQEGLTEGIDLFLLLVDVLQKHSALAGPPAMTA